MKRPLSFTPCLEALSAQESPIPSQDYLIGLRGILVIQSFLFIFFQTFLPAAVVDSKNTTGPLYQIVLRKTLSVLFWNESLIYSFFILLSARTLALPFLANPHRSVCSSSVFRRGIRLWIPTFVAFSLSAAAFSITSTNYISDFIAATNNISTAAPMIFRNFFIYFNSLFDLFWVSKDYASQAANRAFPSGTLWMVSLLFQQSYTVYMAMIIVPYTRNSWRVKAMLGFILTAWWVQSWAWYSITGLLLADAVVNMDFRAKSGDGFRIGRLRVRMWPLSALMVVVGILLQYLFVAWRPQFRNQELKGHTGLYNSDALNAGLDFDQPQARDDNYLIILGIMLLVETYGGLQKMLRWRGLVGLGRRSLAVFLVQPLILYTAGIKLYMRLHDSGMDHEVTVLVCFVVCFPLITAASEVFYRIVDLSSIILAKETWAWVRK
ncbi:hypothetical protein BCR34DRAFT_607201 [Clohesyomyces aquaticus]|uniref:Acyltransferase 3 n=1 Tax=Clohesyomyces aquaticus TaxID=1231657 RepID=A0A1Y1YHT1_9PLEO|nr:hypothetical protein BCR34DRAFT_607201 [Clohesyomyces aquaticus]